MFDILTYEKGAAVLRMMEQYLGADVYRDGIRHYLRKHSYANTITTDLWDALEEVSSEPVRDVMNTWILQGGYPLVTLEDGAITQLPFAYGPTAGHSSIGTSWKIPVMTRSLKGGDSSVHLLGDGPVAVHDDPPVVLNARGPGYFRSRYGVNETAALADHMDELDPLERATVVSDSWALLLSSQIGVDQFFTVARGLGSQDEPTPWGTLATAISFIDRALPAEKLPALADVVRSIFEPQFDRLGWEPTPGESELTPQMRAIVLSTLGTTGDNVAIKAEAIRRFEANDMPGDLANAILRIVANQDRSGDYETFIERYSNAESPQDEQRYQRALMWFNEERVALDAAGKCFNFFRNQDASIIIGLLSTNAASGPAVWKYVTARWDEARDKFPTNTLSYMTFGVRTYINDPVFADEVERFHHEHSLGGEQKSVQQNIERMRVGLTFATAMRAQLT
jgi:puromycin-sensitive aminopeptidase